MHHSPRRGNRNTFGEALIVITAVVGFFYAMEKGLVSMNNLLSYVWFLLLIVGFYFLLLFARMLFFWMTGGEHAPGVMPWWAHQGDPMHPMHQAQTPRPPAPPKKK